MTSKLKIDTRVRSLKKYLDEFEEGAFQIPKFQRDFLWEQDNIKQLFDSIKNNYPIGSILFWKPSENSMEFVNDDSNIGPYLHKVKDINDPIFILDGMQRLSSLFGCLINPNKTNLKLQQDKWEEKFNLFYDLEEEKFIYLRQKSKNQPFQVPVYVFMNSIDFRQYARVEFEKIENENQIELYYDRADELGQIFNNYQIASVDIIHATIEEAVDIFWRVNEKGLPISKDWIVSAMTIKNNDGFRLGTEIDKLLEELKPYNYDKIKRDVIFQCIQNSFGKIYFDYKIEDLVKRKDFVQVTVNTIGSIKKAVKFLYEELLVFNSKMIPYNSQLIFLTAFFNKHSDKSPSFEQIIKLKKWFWLTSYSNYFTIYSLSNQRKAFERFCSFIEDENVNPTYFNEGENTNFITLEFPSKIYFGSVRAKALVLFLIHHYKGMSEIDISSIKVENIESFDVGNLYSIAQKDNPSENFIPVINEIEFIEDNSYLLRYSNAKSPKNYSFLLNNVNEKLFISQDMVDFHKNSVDSEKLILKIRKMLIVNAEKKFVESLGIVYT